MYIIQPKGSCTVLIPYIDQRKKDRERVYPKRNTEKGFKRERERERERGGGVYYNNNTHPSIKIL